MNVLLLTVFISVLLAALFVVLFLEDHRVRRLRSVESVSLLPLEEDSPPSPEASPALAVKLAPRDHGHDHGHHSVRGPHACPNNGKCCGDCKKRKASSSQAG